MRARRTLHVIHRSELIDVRARALGFHRITPQISIMDGNALLDLLNGYDAPTNGPLLLRAIWHALRGEWDEAHAIAQDDMTDSGAWVHAWLHRIEGDLGNAAYWYRRAGRPVATGPTEDEGREIASSLCVDATGN